MQSRFLISPLINGVKSSRTKRSSAWTCASCRAKSIQQRRFVGDISQPQEKPYYVTTPIFYVNAAPHIGHLYSMVLADILKRWRVLQGKEAQLCTGTDEYGMKVQQAAARAGSEPKAFCDRGASMFENLAKQADVSYDRFIRTTDPDHREAVEYFWFLLRERGYIYESKHEGWYSVSDETFYPQSGVHLVLEPATGRKIMASIETGKEVEWTSERNYHFRLSGMKDRLLSFYASNPQFVVPQARMKDVIQAVSSGLEDLSISRPSERMSWGIPVPDDSSQTIYVWVDALTNYLTKTGYPWTPGREHATGWPADVHVVGKDIVRFHCIYWPAFLLALDLPPPKQVLTHAHWTLGRQKMAKSTGNVVNPFFALERFGIDTLRYYLAHDGGIADDADYGNEAIIERYKKGLQGGLGNLSSRILRGKGWNVRAIIEEASASSSSLVESDFDAVTQQQRAILRDLPTAVNAHMDALEVNRALQTIMETVYMTNKYLQRMSPWSFVSSSPSNGSFPPPPDPTGHTPATPHPIHTSVYHCLEAIRLVAILLQPFMPAKGAELLDLLGVSVARRSWEWARLGADDGATSIDGEAKGAYGAQKMELGKGTKGVLFPPLRSER